MPTPAKEIQLRGNSVLQLPFIPPVSLYGAKLGDLNDVDAADITDGLVITRQPDGSFAPEAVGISHPGFRTGYYYSSFNGYTATTRGLVAGRLYFLPFFVHQSTTFTRIGVNVTIAGSGSSIRLGIYANGGGVPVGAPILDAGTVSSGSLGEKEITINQLLPVGWYWLAVVSDSNPSITADSAATTHNRSGLGFATGAGSGCALVQQDITFGALPTAGPTFSDGFIVSNPYRVWLRIV